MGQRLFICVEEYLDFLSCKCLVIVFLIYLRGRWSSSYLFFSILCLLQRIALFFFFLISSCKKISHLSFIFWLGFGGFFLSHGEICLCFLNAIFNLQELLLWYYGKTTVYLCFGEKSRTDYCDFVWIVNSTFKRDSEDIIEENVLDTRVPLNLNSQLNNRGTSAGVPHPF